MKRFKFKETLRVRFAETDAQGVVWNGHYLTYFDVAMTEYLRAMGLAYQEAVGEGYEFVLARFVIDYRAPAAFDDPIEVHTGITRIGRSSIAFGFDMFNADNALLLTQGEAIYVVLDRRAGAPTRVPDRFRELVGKFEGKDFSGAPDR
jgi:acyl-CoA thioester hydrolase